MRENRHLEYKSEVTNTFLKTVSAFSNFEGGKICFGITDDGEKRGVNDPEQVCLDIENRINDSISPKPDYSLSIDQGDHVVTLVVSEGKYKPYLYKGKAYRRSDTATIEVDQVELKRLTLEGSNLYFEELPCGQERLTFQYFEKKMKEKLGISSVSDDVRKTLGFYTKDGQYNIAAALLSDRNSYYGIDVARFGRSISEILDRETSAGVSVLEQYDRAVSMYRRYYQYEKIKGVDRENVEIVPETAFREAVANALVHRTWDMDSHIRIAMYREKIEIASPGGLPRGLTEEEYLNGNVSNLRNPILGNVFFRMNYIEMFGTGIRRIKESYLASEVKPLFHITENSLLVTLPVIEPVKKISSDEEKILNLLTGKRIYSSREIAEELKWSKDKTIRILNLLKESGRIQVTGRGRGTKYSQI